MMPATVRAGSPALLYERAHQLFEQIQDLELMQRNVEECYQAEKRTPMITCLSGQSWTDHAELDGKLMNRVFDHLAGSPEYERFIMEYRKLVQRPDYRRLHTDELFAEYMRLLESGRTRVLNQLKEWQESFAEDGSGQFHGGQAQVIPGQTMPIGYREPRQANESGRIVPAIRLQVQMPPSGSTPLAVVHGVDQSGSFQTVAPTIDMVGPDMPGAQERVAPLEKVSMGNHHGLVKEVRSEPSTNSEFSDAGGKGAEAWDQ